MTEEFETYENELIARRFMIRCQRVNGFKELFQDEFLRAIRIGQAVVDVEAVSRIVLDSLSAEDPCKEADH